jgi:hypothetical protein
MAIVISPRLDEEPLEISGSLMERGLSATWMAVESLEGPRASEPEPHQLAARLADRGVDAWTVAAGRELSLSMRRVRRGG